MKVFCDTNVLIAAFLATHPHHNAARPVMERVLNGTDEGVIAAHSMAEVYAVITRLPGTGQVAPNAAWQLISENLLRNFSIITLTVKEYAAAIESASAIGVEGGKVYDGLLLAAAAKSDAERIYTFNVSHFLSLAHSEMQKRIVAP